MTQIEAQQPVLVYATRPRDDKDDVDVIASTFFIYSVQHFALIDIGSTQSYIAKTISMNLNISIECTASVGSVVSPSGQSI